MVQHPLPEEWTYYGHLPHYDDWSVDSYVLISRLASAEDVVLLARSLGEKLVTSCMFFMMAADIKPVWEDPHNRNGGCFSYKVGNKFVPEVWKNLLYAVSGGCASSDPAVRKTIAGCSISPKKGFCVVKVWMRSTEHTNPSKITVPGLKADGCLFKRHGAND
jgi:hypothetical protein